jgi:hypothetical protein
MAIDIKDRKTHLIILGIIIIIAVYFLYSPLGSVPNSEPQESEDEARVNFEIIPQNNVDPSDTDNIEENNDETS